MDGMDTVIINDRRLERFLEQGETIRCEEMFFPEQFPSKVVYWAVSDKRGWAERV